MNLQAIGITAEYNPFHNGHRWQLKAIRERFGDVPVVACMSGCFVQRGEIALADPWTRAAMAVHAGVDLILLLPAWFSLRSADFFAAGAVKTLAATGLVNMLACGTEHAASATVSPVVRVPTQNGSLTCPSAGNPIPSLLSDNNISVPEDSLADTAAWSLLPETEQHIKTLLQQGISYGAAWETAATRNHKDSSWFQGANNLLSLAYQKALLQYCLSMKLVTLPRQGGSYNATKLTPPYASASAIRTALQNGDTASALASVLPEDSLSLLKLNETDYPARFVRQEENLTLLLANLLTRYNSDDLYEHSSVSRDLCDRFHNARTELQQGYNAFCRKIANKRDPLPSVRRLVLQLLLQKPRAFWTEMPEPSYLRVMAFNDRGRTLLKKMKNTAILPVITKPGSEEPYKKTALYPLLHLDSVVSDLYQLLNGNAGIYGSYFTTSPIYVKKTP